MIYKTKLITAGKLIQARAYKKPLYREYASNREDYIQAQEGEKREDSITRTRNNTMLTIESNLTPYSKFITLTTEIPIYEREEIINQLKLFNRRFKRKYKMELPYLAVIEGQYKRQEKYNLPFPPLHIHMILFIDKYIPFKDLKKLWEQVGSVDIKRVKNNELGVYMMKYITKEVVEFKKKGILKSRNLKTPTVMYLPEYYELENPTFSTTYLFYNKPFEDATIEDVNECVMTELRIK